jgi:acetyltransferase-like isoleucine patch superfamily enzyme
VNNPTAFLKSHENPIHGFLNRTLQIFARFGPGATTLRVWLHRWRGVRVGEKVWIGYDAIIETSYPHLVEIQDGASVGTRAMIIAHFRELRGVVIEEGAFLGPGVIVMPNVKVGRGAVVTAGSVVTASVAPMTLVQGNPAKPVAKIGVMLDPDTPLKQFLKHLKPLR